MWASAALVLALVLALDAKQYTRTWAVHAPGGHEIAQMIARHTGMKVLTQVCSYRLFVHFLINAVADRES